MRRGEPYSVDLLTAKAANEAAEKAISAAHTTCTDANSQRRAEVERCIAESGTGGIAQNDLTDLV